MQDACRLGSSARSSATTLDGARRQSIIMHLTRLLNTREGSCLTDPSYGLPDLTDFTQGTTSQLAGLAQVLSERVGRHEPRLRRLSVHAQDAAKLPPRLRFELRAQLADGARLVLSASIAGSGRVLVQPAGVHA